MKRTYVVNDLCWVFVALLTCLGGLMLGFGSFKQPQGGFMPLLSGLLLGVIAFIDLLSGLLGQSKAEAGEKDIWAEISWRKVIPTVAVLFLYAFLLPTLGFFIATFLLLLFLFRVMERRPWWIVLIASAATTAFFYFGLKVGLSCNVPKGFLGF